MSISSQCSSAYSGGIFKDVFSWRAEDMPGRLGSTPTSSTKSRKFIMAGLLTEPILQKRRKKSQEAKIDARFGENSVKLKWLHKNFSMELSWLV